MCIVLLDIWGGGLGGGGGVGEVAYRPHANLCICVILYFAFVGLVKLPLSKQIWVRFLVMIDYFSTLIFFFFLSLSFFFFFLLNGNS